MQAPRLYYFLLLVLSCCAASAFDVNTTNDLFKVVAAWNQKTLLPGFKCALAPEWIGTVDEKAFDETGKALATKRSVRLNRMLIVPDWHGGTNLVLAMSSTAKTYTYETVFKESLPSADILAKATSFSEVKELLGLPRIFDGGIGHWLFFTIEPTNRVRVLTVTAGSPDWNPTHNFSFQVIGEGIFRSANPNSPSEKEMFKTGRQLSEEYEIDKASQREQFPMPLRSVIEDREKLDDSDLKAYFATLNRFRKMPSRELLQQFVEWIDEGASQVSGIVDHYFFDDKNLDPWENDNRQVALREFMDALPRAKTPLGLTHSLWVILEAEGGGELKLPLVDVSVEVEKNSKTQRMGTTPNKDQLSFAATACRDALKQKYPQLR